MQSFLLQERIRLGLKPKNVYDFLGVDKSTYYRWEQGKSVSSDALSLLADLGFDLNFVVTGKRLRTGGTAEVLKDTFNGYTEEQVRVGIDAYIKNCTRLKWLLKAPHISKKQLIDLAIYEITRTTGLDVSFEEFTAQNEQPKSGQKRHGS